MESSLALCYAGRQDSGLIDLGSSGEGRYRQDDGDEHHYRRYQYRRDTSPRQWLNHSFLLLPISSCPTWIDPNVLGSAGPAPVSHSLPRPNAYWSENRLYLQTQG